MAPGGSFDKSMLVMTIISIVNIASLNLNLLPVLNALLAERHVSRAGARLGLSQPAVSNALAQLRAIFGDPLLVRGPRGMVPTERALALAEPLRAALAQLELGLGTSAPFDAGTADRRFTLVTNDFVAFALLPKLLTRLEREAPGVRLQVRAWQEHYVPPDLARGEADLMLGLYQDLPAGHRQAPLFEDRFVCVARKGHARVRGKLTLATYIKLPHVLVSHQPDGRGVVDDALARKGLTRTVALRVSHFLLVPAIIAATDYVAALSEAVARPFAKAWPLQLLPPPLPLPVGQVRLVWHERTHASAAQAWLRRMISETAARALPGARPPAG
jgi:DNA-binding transcriptional LysR family regulator